MTDAPRTHGGRYERTIETAELDAQAAWLRYEKKTYAQIAQEMGCSQSTAYERVKRAIKHAPAEAADVLRQQELAALDEMERVALEQLRTDHVMVQQGRVVRDKETGEPIIDHEGKLRALDALLKIQQRRARYSPGLETAHQIEQTVHTRSALDDEISGLMEELGRVGQGPTPVDAPDQGADEPANA